MTSQNEIRRTIVLPVARQKVWEAITDPKKLVKWFGNHIEMDRLAVGEMIIFGWDEDLVRGMIAEVSPQNRFAYHWEAGHNNSEPYEEMPTTLVTFTLSDVPEGTQLTMVETGFAALPDNLKLWQLQENNSGWDAELKDLTEYFLQATE